METITSHPSSGTTWLAAFPDLAGIHDPAWQEALRNAKEMTMPAGAVVIHEGDPCQNFMLITQGTIRVYIRNADGREIVFYRTGTGDICILTLRNLLRGAAYTAEAATESEVHAVSIPLLHFQNAMAHSEAFRTYIVDTLAHRLNDAMHLVEQIAFQRLDLRLACLLGQLFGSRNAASIEMTHQELANELGTTREVMSRMLKEFERMGCLRLGRGQIELLSPEALDSLAKIRSK